MQRLLLSLLTVAVLWGGWCACESDQTAPSFRCTGYTMHLTFQDSTGIHLNVNNNTLFRTTTDTGNYKLLAMEALVDSIKLIFNVMDGPYHSNALWDDSLPIKTYHYSKDYGHISGGLVLAGSRVGTGVKYYETDTSWVTLSKWDVKSQTMSGSYYFEANNHAIKGAGTFTNVCFISLK